MATIKDVAKQAGVSTTTVSHVINKTRFVAAHTAQAVNNAIKALNYSPSAVARSLKIKQTNTIGLLTVTSDTPYFAELIKIIQNCCYQKGYMLILCNSHKELEKQKSYLAMLAQKRIDGLLVMCSEYPQEFLELLNFYNKIPMVIIDMDKPNPLTDCIEDNGFQGGYIAGQYLIKRGHRNIGTITGLQNEHTGRVRHKGFMQALTDAGIVPNQDWIIEGDFQPESGYKGLKKILSCSSQPTALFCGGDVIALGAICAAQEAGLKIPEDLSLIGYDDLHSSKYYNPPLTTIHQPKHHLCEKAISLLLDRIINKNNDRQYIELTPTLIERDSVTDGPSLFSI